MPRIRRTIQFDITFDAEKTTAENIANTLETMLDGVFPKSGILGTDGAVTIWAFGVAPDDEDE